MIGATLSHYRITASLGAGGMGEVWRATDSTLEREVAIKLLPEDFADDDERHARFEREAKVLASLNHPNIATLYGLEHLDGRHALVMELVEGEGLDEVISRGPIPIDEAVPIALQIAEALEAAHEAGIVHRDLKPANIRIRPDGTVKVLDFGLAKAWDAVEADGDVTESPTLTHHATAAGMILGTAAYMSPEQARGKPVDRRSDNWAFGVVLWEMLTGHKLFEGDTVTDVLAAVLRETPDLDELPAGTPPPLRRLVSRSLVRDPRERLQWIGDARLELGDARSTDTAEAVVADKTPPASRGRELLAWTMAAIALVATVALWLRPHQAVDRPITRFAVSIGDQQRLSIVDLPGVALSPDGQTLAFIAADVELGKDMIYLRHMNENVVSSMPGTDGANNPFFSPDGSQLAFFANRKLLRIPLDGGSAVALADAANPRGGVWLADDTILYSPEYSSGLWRIAVSGGTPELLLDLDTEAGERTYRFPDVHPAGRLVLYTVGTMESPNNYDEARIAVQPLDGGERTIVIDGANMARFIDAETIAYSRAGVLYAVGFDPDRIATVGQPVPVVEDFGGDPSSGAGHYAIADNGTLAWVTGAVTETDALLTVVDRDGAATRLPLDPRGFYQPRFSPDGKMLAVTVGEGRSGVSGDVWVYSMASEAFNRLTFDGNDFYPMWTPDGLEIVTLRYLKDPLIVIRRVDGRGGMRELVGGGESPIFPESFSPDGQTLAYTRVDQTSDIFLARVGGESELFETDASGPVISPGGRFIAYSSPGSGSTSIFVRPLDGEGKWQASPGLGGYPRWSNDGRRLYYIDIGSAKRPLMEVEVEDAEVFRVGPPRVVVEDTAGRFLTTTAPAMNWDVSPDGSSFVFVEFERDEAARGRIEIALDWAQNLPLAGR